MRRQNGCQMLIGWLVIGGFIYGLRHVYYMALDDGARDPSKLPVKTLADKENNMGAQQSGSSIFSLIYSLVIFIPSLTLSIISLMLRMAWTGLCYFWNIIIYLWRILVVVINIIFMIYSQQQGRRNNNSSIQAFMFLFAILIIIPCVINTLLISKVIAFNVLLPLFLTSFVDIMGDSHVPSPKIIRNLIVFTIFCSIF